MTPLGCRQTQERRRRDLQRIPTKTGRGSKIYKFIHQNGVFSIASRVCACRLCSGGRRQTCASEVARGRRQKREDGINPSGRRKKQRGASTMRTVWTFASSLFFLKWLICSAYLKPASSFFLWRPGLFYPQQIIHYEVWGYIEYVIFFCQFISNPKEPFQRNYNKKNKQVSVARPQWGLHFISICRSYQPWKLLQTHLGFFSAAPPHKRNWKKKKKDVTDWFLFWSITFTVTDYFQDH